MSVCAQSLTHASVTGTHGPTRARVAGARGLGQALRASHESWALTVPFAKASQAFVAPFARALRVLMALRECHGCSQPHSHEQWVLMCAHVCAHASDPPTKPSPLSTLPPPPCTRDMNPLPNYYFLDLHLTIQVHSTKSSRFFFLAMEVPQSHDHS